THYPAPTKGTVDVLDAVAAKMARDNGVHVNPRTDVVITPGSKWALSLALSAITNPGDEIMYLSPAWASYPAMIATAGGTPVAVNRVPAGYFIVTEEVLRAHLSRRSKGLMDNTQCNPTGRVLRHAETAATARVAIEEDLYVITDQVYEKLVFAGRQ